MQGKQRVVGQRKTVIDLPPNVNGRKVSIMPKMRSAV